MIINSLTDQMCFYWTVITALNGPLNCRSCCLIHCLFSTSQGSRVDTPSDFLSSYLTKRNPTNARNNPWFEEWFQHTLQCYTSPSNVGRYLRPCDPNSDLTGKVSMDSDILHVINAVYSAAFALDATLKEKCGECFSLSPSLSLVICHHS